MPKVNLEHRLRKDAGKILKCNIADFYTINLIDANNGDLLRSASFVTCLPRQDFVNIMDGTLKQLQEGDSGYDTDDFWVFFDKRIGEKAFGISNEQLNMHF